MEPMKLKCQCCGHEQEFADVEDAFSNGWDAPPYFSFVACDLCPAVCITHGKRHTKAHARWEKEGRPSGFSVAKCGTDNDLGDPKRIRCIEAQMEQIIALVRSRATKASNN